MITVEINILCDGQQCLFSGYSLVTPPFSLGDMSRGIEMELKFHKWTKIGRKHFCPACTKKRKLK